MKLYQLMVSTIISTIAMTGMSKAQDFNDVAYSIFKDSIEMRTVVGVGNETPKLAAYLADHLKKGGFADNDITIIPHEDTAAMIIRYRGDGRSGKKPILISSHMDVVEALREDWVRDPFTLIEEGDMYFGRGTLDTKLNVAALVATFIRLKSEGFIPSRDIVLAFSGDEETAMATTKVMTKDYRDQIDAAFAIIADGGGGRIGEDGKAFSYTVSHSEKTFMSVEVTARNTGGHSSRPKKDNAIYDLSKAMLNLSKYEFPVLQSELTQAYFEKTAGLVTDTVIAEAMAEFAKDKNDKTAVATLRSYPQYIGATGTTCVATLLKGGHADNALPQSATATINCRIFPGISAEATLDQLIAVASNDALEWRIINNVEAAPESPLNEVVMGAVERVVHEEYPGLPIVPAMSLGATDGKHFRMAGIPSYALTGIFIKSSDGFSHGLNERVPQDNLPRSMRIWHSLITEWAG